MRLKLAAALRARGVDDSILDELDGDADALNALFEPTDTSILDGTCTPVLLVLVAHEKIASIRDEAYCKRFAKVWNDLLAKKNIDTTVRIYKLTQLDAIGGKHVSLALEIPHNAPYDARALISSGASAGFEGTMYSIIDIDEWRAIVRAREARGARTALVVSGIPFTVTDEYVPTLLPYLKRYGELDSYHINTSRTADGTPDGSITFGFFSGGQPLPAQRPSVPIVLNHQYIFSLSPMLGQVRVLAHGDNRINQSTTNCKGCPAVGMPFVPRCKDRAACEAQRAATDKRAPHAARAAREASARAKVDSAGTEP